MKIAKRAEQKNINLDLDYYTAQELYDYNIDNFELSVFNTTKLQ